jgi:carbon storage regulator CsrA
MDMPQCVGRQSLDWGEHVLPCRMALVLTRSESQAVVLAVDGRRIRIEVARIDRGEVRLAFDAPDDVAIWREEMVDG